MPTNKKTPTDNRHLLGYINNPIRNGKHKPYQVLHEDFHEMGKRRKMKFDELYFAIYLRGKSCRYGNPFKLANKTIYNELGTTRKIVDKVKARLQLKGIIKFNSGVGKKWTDYTMLDSVMVKNNV